MIENYQPCLSQYGGSSNLCFTEEKKKSNQDSLATFFLVQWPFYLCYKWRSIKNMDFYEIKVIYCHSFLLLLFPLFSFFFLFLYDIF